MNCHNCGARISPNYIFCSNCGAELDWNSICELEPIRGLALPEEKVKSALQCAKMPELRRCFSTDSLPSYKVLEMLEPQSDFVDELISYNDKNSLYRTVRESLGSVIAHVKEGHVEEGILSAKDRDALQRVYLFWVSVSSVMKETDAIGNRQHIDKVDRYAEDIVLILYADIENPSSNDDAVVENKPKPDEFDPTVRDEILSIISELGDQKPSIKRIKYDPDTDYFNELQNLIGLGIVKKEIVSFIDDVSFQRLRKEKYPGINIDTSFNCVFKGNPGTGKTTVARLVAGLLKQQGVISNGCYVEADASNLVSGWLGFSAKIARLATLEAYGGVLFIDEAYALMNAQGSRANIGSEVIDTLTPLMENNRNDIIVILAGYDKEMDAFFKQANTGFLSRFKKVFHFDDYSSEEMLEIFIGFAAAEKYCLTPEAINRVYSLLTLVERKKTSVEGFANARTVKRVYEKIRERANSRMKKEQCEDISTINIEDATLGASEIKTLLGYDGY